MELTKFLNVTLEMLYFNYQIKQLIYQTKMILHCNIEDV